MVCPLPILLSKAPGNLLGWAPEVTQYSTWHNGQGWHHSMESKCLWGWTGGQIWVTISQSIITTRRLYHIMWSRKWRNLPPQTLSKCFQQKKIWNTQRNKVLHFPIEMPTPIANKKILCCNACPPTQLQKNPLDWAISHYPREQAEPSRFCQVDPANVSSCVAWLGLAWFARVLLACLANLPGVPDLLHFKLQFKSWEYYVRVCDRWRITYTHTYTHTTRHRKLPIDTMLYVYLPCPHSEHPKIHSNLNSPNTFTKETDSRNVKTSSNKVKNFLNLDRMW
jgi:hypothetical protein